MAVLVLILGVASVISIGAACFMVGMFLVAENCDRPIPAEPPEETRRAM